MAQITFTVTEQEKELLKELAILKGIDKPSVLARIAVCEYYKRKTNNELRTLASLVPEDNITIDGKSRKPKYVKENYLDMIEEV